MNEIAVFWLYARVYIIVLIISVHNLTDRPIGLHYNLWSTLITLSPERHQIYPDNVRHLNTYNTYMYLRQGERTKFHRFVDPNVRGAQRRVYSDLRIYRNWVFSST